MNSPYRSCLAVLSLGVILASQASAQAPPASIIPVSPQAPTINLPQPLGVQPGTTVEITLTGTNLADAVALHTGFPAKIAFPTDAKSAKDATKLLVKLEVPPDAPVGLHPLRLATRHGVSNFRPLCVDTLPNAPPASGNRSKSTAAPITAPCVATGRIDPETSDFYKLRVKAGQRLGFEVLARRLGSSLDPIILMHDAKTGRELPSLYCDDAPGCQSDARFTHTFKEDAELIVEVRDSTHRGGTDFWYRLRIGDFPSAIAPMPLAAKRGGKASIGFAGPDLDGTTAIPLAIPTGPQSALALAPKGTRPHAGWPVSLLQSDVDEILEQEPNNDPAKANRVPVPCGISGRLQEKSDLDCFVFSAKKGQRLLINAQTQEVLSPADVYMVLKDAKGAEVGKSNPTSGAGIDFTAAADGDFTLAVEHLNYAFGPNEVYHVTIRTPEPGFDLILATDRLEIPADGIGILPIQAVTRRDYGGPIDVSVVGPPGLSGSVTITAAAPPAPNLPIALLPIQASKLAPGVYEIAIRAKAMINGKETATFANVTSLVRQSMSGLPIPPRELANRVYVAVTDPPFRLAAKYATAEGARGVPNPVTVTATRAKDFTEEITLSVVGLPPNVTAAVKPIAKNANEIQFPLTATAAVPLSTFNVIVIGKGKYQGRDFAVVCAAPLTLVLPFEVKAAPLPPLKPGDKAKLKVSAVRKGGYSGPIDVELKNLPAGVTSAKAQIAAGKSEAELEVSVAAMAAAVEKADVNVTGTAVGHTAVTPNFKVSITKK